ncbi:MAG: tetratricopeptide repeat protein [Candidatus Brocadiae bacterium]|nr:tetratricopeptide repeat protein [Candidatus Brocadiia bacterium]
MKKILIAFIFGFLSFIFSQEKDGMFFYKQKEWNKAEKAWLKELNSLQKDSQSYTKICDRLGILYIHKKEYRKAILYLNKAASIKEKFGISNDTLDRTYHNMGVAYERMGKQEKAEEYYQKSLEVVQALPIKPLPKKDFPATLSIIRNNTEKISVSKDNVTKVMGNDSLELEIKQSGHLKAYKKISTAFAPADSKLNLSPSNFIDGKATLQLSLSGITQDTIWIWYYSEKEGNPPDGFFEKLFSLEGLVSQAKKGIEVPKEQSPVNHSICNTIFIFLVSEDCEYKIARLDLIHTPLQLEMFLKDKGLVTQSQKLKAGDEFAIRLTQYEKKPLYVYGFHADGDSVCMIYPTKSLSNPIQRGTTILLPDPSEYYKIDNKDNEWEYQFFFYSEKPCDEKELKDWLEDLSKKQSLEIFTSDKLNSLVCKNFTDIVAKPKIKTNLSSPQKVMALKFKKEKK